MRKLIEQSAELQTYGALPYSCGCHSLNNHGKDLCKLGRIPDIKKRCTILLKYFRNKSDAEVHVKTKLAARNLPWHLQADTRWHYLLRMMESLIRSMNAIDDVYNDWRKGTLSAPSLDMGDKADPFSIAGILSSDSFWKEVKTLALFLKSVALCVKLLESDLTPIRACVYVLVHVLHEAGFNQGKGLT